MEIVFVIGGMGAGKSTARKALVDRGVECIDLDLIGHEILHWDVVKEDLAASFGNDIFDENGEVNRRALAQKAFVGPAETHELNRITQPRIEEVLTTRLSELEEQGCPAVVVEYSVFRSRELSLADVADVVVAVTAPVAMRIERAVACGFDEEDVRRRIAQQITDADRIEEADVVFSNEGTREELYAKVANWWHEYNDAE